MTKHFDIFVKKMLRECDMGVSSVLGNDGAYDASDTRTPVVMGSMQRRNNFKRKRKKKN